MILDDIAYHKFTNGEITLAEYLKHINRDKIMNYNRDKIMNYEQKYKEALRKLQEALAPCEDGCQISGLTRDCLENIFPELAESEDEQSKNWILEYLYDGLRKTNEQFKNQFNAAINWLEKQDNKIVDCQQNHQDVKHPNGGIVMEDFNGGEGFYKLNLDYLNKKQVEEVEEMVRTWNKESKTSDENIKNCIGMCLTDANEQRFKDYGTTLKDCLAWLENQELKSNHYSGVSFKYNGHIWGMCARDNGVEISMDGNLKAFISLGKSFVYPVTSSPFKAENFYVSKVDGLIHDMTYKPTDNVEPKFKVGDTMRTWREAANGYTDGMPVVVSIDNEYYHCNNELIAIKDQDNYEFPPINAKQKSSDKAGPKFKVGDWIVNNVSNDIFLIKSINGIYCTLEDTKGNIISPCLPPRESDSHIWTIDDAKDGDVVYYKDEISLYKHNIINCTKQEATFGGFVYYCCYDSKSFIIDIDSLYSLAEQEKIDIHPATKEQRDLLFQKMKEAGYEWDSEKKELKKIEEKG